MEKKLTILSKLAGNILIGKYKRGYPNLFHAKQNTGMSSIQTHVAQ